MSYSIAPDAPVRRPPSAASSVARVLRGFALVLGVGLALPGVALAQGAPGAAKVESGSAPEAAPTAEQEQAAREEAGQRFQRGLGFYGDGDYALALIEFDRAYQLVPDYRVLYNIGQVSIQLGRFARARQALEQYMAEGGAAIPPERAEEVGRDLAMLEDRTAYLELSVEPVGVEVIIDDRSFGETPLAALLLDAGEHQVVLKKHGFQTVTRRVVLAGAERLPLGVQLALAEEQVVIVQKPDVPAAPPPPVDAPERGGPHPAVYAWIGTGVLATAAITTGILGLDAKSRYDALNVPNPDEERLAAAASEARAYFLACDILTITTAAAFGTSLYLTLHKPKAQARSGGGGRGAAFAPASVQLALLPHSVQVRGTF